MSLIRLGWRQVVRRRAWTVALGACLTAVVVAAAAPLLAERSAADRALGRALSGTALSLERDGLGDTAAMDSVERTFRRQLETELGPDVHAVTASTAVTMAPVSVNDRRIGNDDDRRITVRTLDDLPRHVDLLAGQFPPAARRQEEALVTTWRAAADELGIRLSDLVCLDFASTRREPRWCARVVGLWEPEDMSDPFWGGSPPRLELIVDRRDLPALVRLGPPRGAVVSVRAAPDPVRIRAGDAERVAERVRRLRGSLNGQRQASLRTSLDQVLLGLAGEHRLAADAARRVTVGLSLLALCLLLVVGGRFFDLQAREVARLAARGWSPGRLRGLLLFQIAVACLPGLAVGLALAQASALPVAGWAASQAWLAGPDGPAAALAIVLVAAAGLLGFLVADAAIRDTAPLAGQRLTAAGTWWQRGGLDLLTAPPALALLALPYLLGGVPAPGGTATDFAGFVLRVLAVALLGLAALRLLPAAGSLAASGQRGVPSRLAEWELARHPDQHSDVAFLLALTVAISIATAGAAASALGPGPDSLRAVLIVSLFGGCLAGLVIGLVGFATHFRAAVHLRAQEHGILAFHGLPAAGLRRSLAIEQLAVLGYGLVVGTLLGVALLVSLSAGGGGSRAASTLLGVVAAPLLLMASASLVGWLARRNLDLPTSRELEVWS